MSRAQQWRRRRPAWQDGMRDQASSGSRNRRPRSLVRGRDELGVLGSAQSEQHLWRSILTLD